MTNVKNLIKEPNYVLVELLTDLSTEDRNSIYRTVHGQGWDNEIRWTICEVVF